MMLFTGLSIVATMMFLAWRSASKAVHWIGEVFAGSASLPAIPPHEGTTVEGEQSEIFSTVNRKSPVSFALHNDPTPPENDAPADFSAVVARFPGIPEPRPSLDWGSFERPTVIRRGVSIDDTPRW